MFMKFNDWIKKERGRQKALASFLGIDKSAITHWKTNGVPREHMLDVRAYSQGAVSLEEMLEDHRRVDCLPSVDKVNMELDTGVQQ